MKCRELRPNFHNHQWKWWWQSCHEDSLLGSLAVLHYMESSLIRYHCRRISFHMSCRSLEMLCKCQVSPGNQVIMLCSHAVLHSWVIWDTHKTYSLVLRSLDIHKSLLRPLQKKGSSFWNSYYVFKDLSMMYRALWDRRHSGATQIRQCTRRYAPRALTDPRVPFVPPISQCTIHHA